MTHRDKVIAGIYLSGSALLLASIPIAFSRSAAMISAAITSGGAAQNALLLREWTMYYLPPAAGLFALAGYAVLRNRSFRRQAHQTALVFFLAPLPLFALAWFST